MYHRSQNQTRWSRLYNEHRKEGMERHMMMTHDDIERRRNVLRYRYETHITAQNHTKRRGPHNRRKRARRVGHTGNIQRKRQKTRQARTDTETEAEGTQTDTGNETERTSQALRASQSQDRFSRALVASYLPCY